MPSKIIQRINVPTHTYLPGVQDDCVSTFSSRYVREAVERVLDRHWAQPTFVVISITPETTPGNVTAHFSGEALDSVEASMNPIEFKHCVNVSDDAIHGMSKLLTEPAAIWWQSAKHVTSWSVVVTQLRNIRRPSADLHSQQSHSPWNNVTETRICS